jgi:hypothetical protein
LASDAKPNDFFGGSLAMDGTFALIGATGVSSNKGKKQ